MKFIILFCLTVLFSLNKQSFSQSDDLYSGISDNIMDKVNIKSFPGQSSFFTVQVSAVKARYIYDDDLISSFVLINPVYVRQNNGWIYFSVGLFNSREEAQSLVAKIKYLYRGAFPVAYTNGSKVSLYDFDEGNVSEKKVDVNGALKKINKVLKKAYYRVQTGYYVQPELTGDEQNKYDRLNAEGYEFIQEKHKDGKLYLSKIKYKNRDDVLVAKREIRGIMGNEVLIKAYYKNIGIRIGYLRYMKRHLSMD